MARHNGRVQNSLLWTEPVSKAVDRRNNPITMHWGRPYMKFSPGGLPSRSSTTMSSFERLWMVNDQRGQEWKGCGSQTVYGGRSVGAGKLDQKAGLVSRPCQNAWSRFQGIRSHPLCRWMRIYGWMKMVRILQVILPESFFWFNLRCFAALLRRIVCY